MKDKQNLLDMKLAEMTRMLELTEAAVFTCDESVIEEEVERFYKLYNRRENILNRIKALDKELESTDVDYGSNKSDAEMFSKMKEIAKALIEHDKKNQVISGKFSKHIKDNLKHLKDTKTIYNAYTDEYGASSGNYFDSKN